jgi:hypothetical protein
MVMRLRLVRKLAEEIDGVDLSHQHVGDVFDLPGRKAQLLVAEGWAIAERRFDGPDRVIAFRRVGDPGQHLDDNGDVSHAS